MRVSASGVIVHAAFVASLAMVRAQEGIDVPCATGDEGDTLLLSCPGKVRLRACVHMHGMDTGGRGAHTLRNDNQA